VCVLKLGVRRVDPLTYHIPKGEPRAAHRHSHRGTLAKMDVSYLPVGPTHSKQQVSLLGLANMSVSWVSKPLPSQVGGAAQVAEKMVGHRFKLVFRPPTYRHQFNVPENTDRASMGRRR
jgi:hypothetical protein